MILTTAIPALARKCILILFVAAISSTAGAASTNLADAPIGATIIVPANLILDLSVEFPTGDSDAYYSVTNYVPATEYLGYWNPKLCYEYKADASARTYFVPKATAAAHVCSGYWSGNFLNWTLTQTIDPFRQALTGGYRSIDEVSLTVLQKAFADFQAGTGNAQVKSLTTNALVKGATPFNWNTIYVSNLKTGLNFVFRGSGNPAGTTGVEFSSIAPAAAVVGTTYQAQGAVQVCGAFDNTDTRCRAYGTNYKPVGLMQKYAAESTGQVDAIRYSAFGYLNDSVGNTANQQLGGGVMRAKMKSVGPYAANPGTTPVLNTAAEWSAVDGRFVINPNPIDATASAVTNSGVINYLNKFGFSGSYKRYDSVSELYYMATRYYRNLGNIASHTTNAATLSGEATNDNFPVITGWDDPVKYSCSKNYIIGIGDIHTWNDANVPGNTVRGGMEPVVPPEVIADTVVNARTATNFIGNLEHIAGLTGGGSSDYVPIAGLGDALLRLMASPSGGWCCDNNSFYMAGLAYDVHTRDIRPDITPKLAPVTVSTFWLDVMETNDYHEKNQFWMTAKYGGFDTSNTTAFPGGYSQYGQTAALPLGTWNTGDYRDDRGNSAPDQYFQAANPAAMISGLSSAFAKIRANVPSGTSTALSLGSSTIAATGNANYSVSYASDWSGDVIGNELAVTSTGGVITTTSTVKWHAHDWLPNTFGPVTGVTPLTPTTRIIATSSATGAANGTAFRFGSLTSAQKATLGSTAAVQSKVLDYLRGDQSLEGASPAFRPRVYTLGDITNSKPAVVTVPSFPYADAPLNPGYSTFVSAQSARQPVIYVGANDGMMHAFDASMSSATGGKELFAYVPSLLFNSNTDSAGNKVGLGSLVVNPLQHHFMVDAQPTVIDVDFARTRASGAAPADSVPSNWRTILVSGLGKGGKGFFGLDVTDPSSITSEGAMAGKVLWEASLPHMGSSYGTPLIVKTANYGWVAVLTSGYDNDDGHGYIYLVSPSDGTEYARFAMPDGGTLANPAGLAFVSGYINNYSDYTADSLYAGDLLGNVWRVDLRAATSGTIQKFATLTDALGNPQPVTTEPVIGTDPSTLRRYVFVGTGRLLADTDLVSSLQQTFYAFTDGDNTAFDAGTATLTRTSLANNSILAAPTGAVVTGVTVSPTQRGFFVDLAQYLTPLPGQQAAAERINVQAVASGGVVAFGANLFGLDPCSGGSSRLFALGYDSGAGGTGAVGNSLFTNVSGTPVAAINNPTGSINSVSLVATPGGGLNVLAGNNGNVVGGVVNNPAASLKKLNWREVPSVN